MKKLHLLTETSGLLSQTDQQQAKQKHISTIEKCFLRNDTEEFLTISNIKDIPQMFSEIPQGYVNNIAHRGNYTEEEMNETLEDGTHKVLHLDIDFGKNCSLSCPHCFKNNGELKKMKKEELSIDELKQAILQFKELGLKTIKICGAGEPFHNEAFLPFLEWMYANGLRVSIFTKGYVIGDDTMVKKLYGAHGITTGEALAKKLKELDISILLSLNSFDNQIQKQYSGATSGRMNTTYIPSRDLALIHLINAGLNEYIEGEATRLAIVMAPMKPENLGEVKDIYTRGRMRNIYPVGCPANLAGNGKEENERIEKEHAHYVNDLIDLYTELYIWNINHGIITLEQIKKEGISLYPGCHPCTQSRIGAYLNLYGELLSCPGHDEKREELQISKNIVKEVDYKEMWKKSQNYQRTGFNQKCIARDGYTLTLDFYDKILQKIEKHYQ